MSNIKTNPNLLIFERMAMKRQYLGKEKPRGGTMPRYWTTKGESCLQLLIVMLCKTTRSKCIWFYFAFNFPIVWLEIEENKHSNSNGTRLQLAYAWVCGRKNTKSAHSQCASPACTQQGLHPCVLKKLINFPGHKGWVSPDSTKEQNKNHA